MWVIRWPGKLRVLQKPGLYYSNIENLVLWARSEATGYAVDKCLGVMEYLNVGIMGS
jgi:hypothetical protein